MYLSVPVIILIAIVVYWTWPKYPPTAEQAAAMKEQSKRDAAQVGAVLDSAIGWLEEHNQRAAAKKVRREASAQREALVRARPMTTKDWERTVLVLGGLALLGAVAYALS